MVKLFLMASASQGYVPGFVFQSEHAMRRLSQDCQPLLLSPGSTQDVVRPGFLSIKPLGQHKFEQPLSHMSGLLDSNQFVSIDSTITRPVVIDMQDKRHNSVLFSFGIAKQCTNQGKISELLSSGSSEVEEVGLKPTILNDLMGIQAMPTEMSQCLYSPDYGFCDNAECHPTLFYPDSSFYSKKPLLDLVGDLAQKSDMYDQAAFSSTRAEMKDILNIIAAFYLSRDSTKWRKQSLLVPQFNRLEVNEAKSNIHGSLKLEPMTVVPLKSPQKTRFRSSPKRKSSHRAGKERALYRTNYSHSCESLLSIIFDKKPHRKTTILELKKSGPELSQLLTQFSASIAGTGLALLLSVVCKVATGRVPFCASKLLNTGLGFGLVWLSSAVNRMRDMIINISKNSGKRALKEEEMLQNLDNSVKEIFFRAATLTAVMVLRLS